MILVIFPWMRVRGMALFPFVLVRRKDDCEDNLLINHEKIHLRQQLELLVLPFYLLYIVNYLYNLIQNGDHNTAYKNILFEQEAYDHQSELNYLKTRKWYAFLNYL